MTRVLLLGATGFIGRHVRAALEATPGVTGLVCPRRTELDLLTAEEAQLGTVLGRHEPNVVVNCTGRLDGTRAELMTVHAMVTARLLDAIAARAPHTRLVRLGSAGEYGPVGHGTRIKEGSKTRPVGAYGVSHLAATHLVRAAKDGGADAVSLRVFNPIGAGAQGNSVLVRAAERISHALHTGDDAVTMGPLGSWRDLVDARDVARAVVAAAIVPSLPAAVVNVGRGHAVRTRDAVMALADLAGYRGRIVESGDAPARSQGVDWTCADPALARDTLAWAPSHSLEEALSAIWADVQSRAAVTA